MKNENCDAFGHFHSSFFIFHFSFNQKVMAVPRMKLVPKAR